MIGNATPHESMDRQWHLQRIVLASFCRLARWPAVETPRNRQRLLTKPVRRLAAKRLRRTNRM